MRGLGSGGHYGSEHWVNRPWSTLNADVFRRKEHAPPALPRVTSQMPPPPPDSAATAVSWDLSLTGRTPGSHPRGVWGGESVCTRQGEGGGRGVREFRGLF